MVERKQSTQKTVYLGMIQSIEELGLMVRTANLSPGDSRIITFTDAHYGNLRFLHWHTNPDDSKYGLVEEGAKVHKTAHMGSGSIVRTMSILSGNVILGSDVLIDKTVIVHGSVKIADKVIIKGNVTIGSHAEIGEMAIIKSGATIGRAQRVAPKEVIHYGDRRAISALPRDLLHLVEKETTVNFGNLKDALEGTIRR